MKSSKAQFKLNHDDWHLDANFDLPDQGVLGLFGRSGSGKSSILRELAGLDQTKQGLIQFKGQTWQDDRIFVPPEARRVGMVFQYSQLFPHLDVRGNLHFAAKRRHAPTELGWDAVVEMMCLQDLLSRSVQRLSGGERQRVAMARTLLSQPQLLLFDEPMASLDQSHKKALLPYLLKVVQKIQIPMIYVSHDVEEMAAVCDQVIELSNGQTSPAVQTQHWLARLQGHEHMVSSLLLAEATEHSDGLTAVETKNGNRLSINEALTIGTTYRLLISANEVSLATEQPGPSTITNHLTGTITASKPSEDNSHLLTIDCQGDQIISRVSDHSIHQLSLQKGQSVHLQFKAQAIRCFESV